MDGTYVFFSTVNDNFVEVGIDRTGYQMMEGSVCQLNIEVIDGNWEKSAIDVYGSVYAPGVSIERPSEIGDGAEVSATISCLAPWTSMTIPVMIL